MEPPSKRVRTADEEDSLTLPAPHDMHAHLRDGPMLPALVAPLAKRFTRVLVMPNLVPPVTTTKQASEYRDRILKALEEAKTKDEGKTAWVGFEPIMTLYLTQSTTPAEIKLAKESKLVRAVKLYPQSVTTNSSAGVSDVEALYPTFRAMAEHGLLLLVHAEDADPSVDIFDREASFVRKHLAPLHQAIPELKIVVEHVSTKEGVDFVCGAGPNVAATITPQHLLFNRNKLFFHGLNAHYFCMPILKADPHKQALQAVVRSGNRKFFLGTDSAPHSIARKAAGAAGCYSGPVALEIYAHIFDQIGCLPHLKAFACENGAAFYGFGSASKEPPSVTLVRKEWEVPSKVPLQPTEKEEDGYVVPLCAGDKLTWQLASNL